MYSSQEPNSSQPQMDPYSAQGMYPPPESTAYPYPPPPQGGYQYPPQGAYPPPQGGGPYPYPPQGTYMPQGRKIQNRRANRAMLYGIFSIFLALVTLVQEVGAAGVITGTFAIIYGFRALKVAKQLPGNAGRAQAITGIVLGFVAWFLVIISLIIRTTIQGS
jgi:hypothetical protein